jgi:uncharacterized protein YndB with AHSA1/START domain
MHGTYELIDGRATVRFERRLAHSVERVWRAITEPAELAHWFPDTIRGELSPGAPLRFEHESGFSWEGEVKEFDPPSRLAFMWGGDLLEFELEPLDDGDGDGDGCLLRFTAVMSERDKAARDAAGWHVCLDRLGASLAGIETAAPTSETTSEWRALYAEYEARGLPTGAEIPG